MRFLNREQAGELLASKLVGRVPKDTVVLGLARGGVPVAAVVARALGAECEVMVCRKLGAPGEPELGMGAIAEGGALWIDRDLVRSLGVSADELDEISHREEQEISRRVQAYRGGRPLPPLAGRTVILVDDGIAMGGTMRAAIRAVRHFQPAKIVVAVPVAPASTFAELRSEVDEAVAVQTPRDLIGIGLWYEDFGQVNDDLVLEALGRARAPRHAVADGPASIKEPVRVDAGGVHLQGDLCVPSGAQGIVVFAHGSGSSRRSVRNRMVARSLNEAGCATLLFDLLTEAEEIEDRVTAELRFDIALLSRRLVGAVEWVSRQEETAQLPIGCFGSSTGAAAALIAAALRPGLVKAVVSRGGRPDLAGRFLPSVRAPTLLIVGGADEEVLDLNEQASRQMHCERRIEVVSGATHLFEEPGTLEEVCRLAAQWFSAKFRAVQEALPASI